MRLTRSSVILAVVGVLLLAGAAVVRFAVLPAVSTLPSDFDTTQAYSGTYDGVNPSALARSSAGTPLLRNAPLTASRRYQTSSLVIAAVLAVRGGRRPAGPAQPLPTDQPTPARV